MKAHSIGLVLSDINMPNMDGLQLEPGSQCRRVEEYSVCDDHDRRKSRQGAGSGATRRLRVCA